MKPLRTAVAPPLGLAPPCAQPYDFRSTPPLRSAELAAVRAAGIVAAEALAGVGGGYLQCDAEFRCRAAVTAWHPERDWKEASAWVIAEGPDSDHQPVWRLDPELWGVLVDLMVGARRELSARPADARPSRLESRLIARLCGELFAGWSALWPLRATAPTGWRCVADEESVAGPEIGRWVRLCHSAEVAGRRGAMDIFVPISLARLPTIPVPDGDGLTSGPVSTGVSTAPVNVRAQLAAWHTTVRGVGCLEEGALLPLSARSDQPVVVTVAGQPKFLATVGKHEGLVALKVVRRLSDGDPD